jgi:hypothetical protein
MIMPGFYFHRSAPDQNSRDSIGCAVNDLGVRAADDHCSPQSLGVNTQGEPDIETQRIYEGCVAAFSRGMEDSAPVSIVSCMNEVECVIDDAGLGICETGIHGH